MFSIRRVCATAQTTVEVAVSDYSTGQSGFLELLDAERTLFSFGNKLDETIGRYTAWVAELERTVGASTAEFTDENEVEQ